MWFDVFRHADTATTYMDGNFKKTNGNIEKANRFIINAYKVLLTRGIKGCYIYCEDPDLKKYLESEWHKFKQKYS